MSVSIAGLSTAGIKFTRGMPRIALGLEAVEPRKILVLGSIDRFLERRLESAGAKLAKTSSILEAQRALVAQTFDAVLVQPEVHGALDLVKTIKLGGSAASLRSAGDRHTAVPFFVLPFSGETEYAVIVRPPLLAYLEDEQQLPIAEAVLKLDVDALTRRLPSA
ncbi:MAG TPA: hypothetical protein VGK67_14105 [Myxococcales bacterium]